MSSNEQTLPGALSLLAGRNGAIEKVIQSLESLYQNAESAKAKSDIEKKVLHYVADYVTIYLDQM